MRILSKIFAITFLVFQLGVISVFSAEGTLGQRDKNFMLNLSRETMYWYLEDKAIPDVQDKYLTPGLLQKKAVFVTLKDKNGNLRGCMGMFEPVETPLYKNIIDRTKASLAEDPRFINHRITYDELNSILIEISILSKPEDLEFSSPEDLLSKLRPNVDGVVLSTPYGTSTYLPQVWEQLPNKEDFLSNLCEKHGAPSDYWKTNYKQVKVATYSVVHFAEEVPGGKIVGEKRRTVGKGGGIALGHVLPLEEGLEYGAYPVKEGQELQPGTIVNPEMLLVESQKSEEE